MKPVLNYINRWRALSLKCKDRFFEASVMEMCTQGMVWDLLYVLQMSKPWIFQELAAKAHDIQVAIASHGNSFSIAESKRDRAEVKRNVKFSKNSTKNTIRRRPTLKELQEKKYLFPDSNLPEMLDDLLEKGVIQLLEPKRPEEVGRTTDPKHCRYHRM